MYILLIARPELTCEDNIKMNVKHEVGLNLPGRKGLEDWWEKRGEWKKTGMTEATVGRRLYNCYIIHIHG
jgi:hypothetical protein